MTRLPPNCVRLLASGSFSRAAASCLLWLTLLNAARAGAPDENQIAAWIRQLGAEHYMQRDEASAALLAAGPAAVGQLEAALTHGDTEVWFRARKILEVIHPASLQRDVQQFARGADLKPGHPLFPSWEALREIVGDTPAARRWFAGMCHYERELLTLLADDRWQARYYLTERCTTISNTLDTHGLPAESIAALIFASVVCEEPPCCRILARLEYLVRQPEFRERLHGETGEPLLKLLGALVGRDWCDSPFLAYRGMALAIEFHLAEGISTCVTLVNNSELPVRMRMEALLAIAALGTTREVETVERFFADEQTWYGCEMDNPAIPQMRDVALLAAVVLTAGEPREYGFCQLQPDDEWGYDLATIVFTPSATRRQAFVRWQQRNPPTGRT